MKEREQHPGDRKNLCTPMQKGFMYLGEINYNPSTTSFTTFIKNSDSAYNSSFLKTEHLS
jgi:hypothetical protein